jgi:hypothetical protein
MPSKSKEQHNLMAMVANDPAASKRLGIPQSVGKDYTSADKGKKFGSGGKTRVDSQTVNQPKTNHGDMAVNERKTNHGDTELFKKGGNMASKMNPGFMAMMAKKKDAKPSAMGKPTMKPGMSTAKDGMKKPTPMAGMMGMKKGGIKKMAAGGAVDVGNSTSMGKVRTASPSRDGVASKGKTKGTQISMPGNKGMKSGGMAKKYC